MSFDNRLSFVREMRRNRARRLAVARAVTRTRSTAETSAETSIDGGSQASDAAATPAAGTDIEPRRPLIYLGRHGRSRLRAGFLAYLLSMRVYPALAAATVFLASALAGTSAYAAGDPGLPAPDTLTPVIDNLRIWLIAVLAAIATLFFVIGGLRYLASNGDPGEIERAKSALKSSAIGYALALLAPLFIGVVTSLFKR
jgi:hypothetical protein